MKDNEIAILAVLAPMLMGIVTLIYQHHLNENGSKKQKKALITALISLFIGLAFWMYSSSEQKQDKETEKDCFIPNEESSDGERKNDEWWADLCGK